MGAITVPEPLPSSVEDSVALRKAFEGWGTDEKSIIKILGHRTASDRLKIRQTYEQLYKESLTASLESELSGDFLKAVTLWTLDPPERDAQLAKDALLRRDSKHLVILVEIACASSPTHLVAVRQAYCARFSCSLEEDIRFYVSQPLTKLLTNLVSAYKFDRDLVDEELARAEAAKLYVAVEKRKLDEDYIIWILSTRNRYQLKRTFKFYQQKYGKTIEQDIEESMPNRFGSLFEAAIMCINAPEKYFAEVIRSSIAGLGTDEDSLTRVIVTRAEIDMIKIKHEYELMYKVNLVDDVIGDTSGDYKDMLVTLLGSGKY